MTAFHSACAALALVASAAMASAAPRPALGFEGARLGMTLKDWRAVPAAPGTGPDAIPICSNEDKAVRIPGYPLSVHEAATGVVVCGYKARFGHQVLNHSVNIGGSFTAQGVAYVFRRGRLDQIRFTASTDAYDDIRNMFGLKRSSNGAGIGPQGVKRTRTWRLRSGEVKIGRGQNPTELTVDLLRRR